MKLLFFLISISFTIIFMNCGNKSKQTQPDNDEIVKPAPESNQNKLIESYKTIDPAVVETLNTTIQSNSLHTNDEISNAYSPKNSEAEGDYTYTISTLEINDNTYEITILELGLMDDSMKGKKSILTISTLNELPTVISIKENYKCWTNRGHDSWNADPCQ